MHILISAVSRHTQPTGVCRHAANLARCLVEADDIRHVTLVVGTWQQDYFRRCFDLRAPKLAIETIDIANTSWSRNRWFAFGLPRVARRLCPSLVHMAFPVPVLRPLFRVPVVATIHDLYPFEFPQAYGRRDSFLKRAIFRECILQADGLASVSQATVGALRHWCPALIPEAKLAVVNNYAEFDTTVATPPAQLGTSPGPFILSVGQHQRNKQLDVLIEAFQRLRQCGAVDPGKRLVIVGSGTGETERLEMKARELGVDQRIVWLAALDDAEMVWLYRHCELVVCNSRTEGFCLPLLEALYFSCRVVCSDIPVLREVSASSGSCVFFDLSHDLVANLAEAIVKALRLPPRSPSTAIRFSKQSTLSQCLSLYSQLLPQLRPAQDKLMSCTVAAR